MDTLATIAVGLGSGCIGSLLTTLLAPLVQHHFWRKQRRAELCLQIARRTAELAARFEEQWPRWKRDLAAHQSDPEKTAIFYTCVGIDAELRVLFSEEAWNEFSVLKTIILTHSSVTHDEAPFNLDAYARARNAAMRALYGEVGLASPRAAA